MLKLYFDEAPEDVKGVVIDDVEMCFSKITLKYNEEEKTIVKLIDNGELIDNNSFIDRFGYKLYVSELSTGCKAALCLLNCPDKIINLKECGLNARDIIISLCTLGAAVIDTNTIMCATDITHKEFRVQVDDYLFTKIERFNEYLTDEWPFEPDLEKEGIEVIKNG